MNISSSILALLAAQDSKLVENLAGLLPLVLFLLILYFFLRGTQRSPLAKLQSEYMRQQMEISPRIEALLERIAKALERDGKA